jgi:thiamine biosynthesis lipoprotein
VPTGANRPEAKQLHARIIGYFESLRMTDRIPCHLLQIGRFLMACQFEVLLNAGYPSHAGDAAMEALNRIEWLEQKLSVYLPDSELSQVNRLAYQGPQRLSSEVAELLQLGLRIHQETEGGFDITAAALSETWGFAQRQGRMPSPEQIAEALERVGTRFIDFQPEAATVRYLRPGLKINSGGIGKGYALDQAAGFFQRRGITDFLIHGGKSSVLAAGHRWDIDSQEGWRVAVNHPEQPRLQLGELTLFDTALGTSGPANQFFYYNGKRYGHIIDPRTGWPASGMLSITVLHPSATYADALATGLYVLGIDAAIAYCQKHPETAILAILPTARSGQVEIVTANLGRHRWKAS